MKRTWCKYNSCSLEKLEFELELLNKLWTNLEKNWAQPKDIEDVYRIYPLLDTTAILTRKIVTSNSKKDKKYKIEVIIPTNDKTIDTKNYVYPDEYKFFNGEKKEEFLADIVSVFMHGSEYTYMDTRKKIDTVNDFKIYIFVKTDILCQSCAEANLENPKTNKPNYKKTTQFIRYDDCTCGIYINIRSYINSILELIKDKKIKRSFEKQNSPL